LEMLLTNRWIGSDEALRIGLVNQVVPKNKLFETADEMAKKIASHDPIAVRNAKQAVVKGLDLSLQEGLELEKRLAFMTSQSRKGKKSKAAKAGKRNKR
jgi:enoyl-CoA hydratase/carnithine racemase